MLPNQNYYQQPNNYMMPQYQNFQAQQRQEQLNQVFANSYTYNYVKERSEAENWPIAPGNHLVFEDQNGVYFYTKSLGFAPNDRPVFSVFKREGTTQEPVQQEPSKIEQDIQSTQNELALLKGDISELKEMLNQLTHKPTFDKYNQKKGGNK